jgi:glycerol-3-phosphate dehydrogenase
VAHAAPGLVVVAGGKYTTYRVMAKDAVDAVTHALDDNFGKCVTERVPCVGAEGYEAAWNRRHVIAEESGLHVARVEHLLVRYGTLIDEVLAMVREDPALGEPLPGAEDYLKVEVAYACSHEGARHLDDVFARRTHISIEMWDRGVAAAPVAAEIMGRVLGWSEDQVGKEVDHYLKRVEAERLSQQQLDDETADAARLGAPEIVPLA